MFYPEFDLMALIKGAKVMVTDAAQEQSVLNDLRLYAFLALILLAGLVVLALVQLMKRYRDKARAILNDQLKKWRYNQLIQSIDITYIEVCLTVGTQATLALKNSEW